MSPTLNGSSEIQRFECADAIEIRDRIMFVFYPGLPHISISDFCGLNYLIQFSMPEGEVIKKKCEYFGLCPSELSSLFSVAKELKLVAAILPVHVTVVYVLPAHIPLGILVPRIHVTN